MTKTVNLGNGYSVPLKWLLVVIFVWPGTIVGALSAGSTYVDRKIETHANTNERIRSEQFKMIQKEIDTLEDSIAILQANITLERQETRTILRDLQQELIKEIRKNGNHDEGGQP